MKSSHFLWLVAMGFTVLPALILANEAAVIPCLNPAIAERSDADAADQAKIASALALGPVLARAIRASRADAIHQGVRPLPSGAKQALAPYFPAEILGRARYRVGTGGVTLQTGSLQFGDRVAIVLDDVIILDNASRLQNPYLLAHELAHVMQYQTWGIDGFARYYIADSSAVEGEARAIAKDWLQWRRGRSSNGPQIADRTEIDIAITIAEAMADQAETCPE